MVPRPDDKWLEDLQSDDPVVQDQAMADLQHRLRRIIFAQFLAKGLSGSCIDDVVQETSLRIFQRLDRFRGDAKFMTWATAFAVRTGLEMIRRGFWAARTASDFMLPDQRVELAEFWTSVAPSPELNAQRDEVLMLLSEAINKDLTPRQRSALLRELQGWSITEIAAEMGTTRGAVYKLTHDARKKLKSVLEAAGIDGQRLF